MKARAPRNAFLDGYLLLAAGLTTNSKLRPGNLLIKKRICRSA